MKKQWTTLFLVLLMTLNLAGCGNADPKEPPVQTQHTIAPSAAANDIQATVTPTVLINPIPTTPPPAATTPPATTTPPGTEPTEDLEIADVDSMIFAFPLLEEIGGTTLTEIVDNQDGTFSLFYPDADLEALEEYLYYCSTCGLYPFLVAEDETVIVYELYPIGVSFFCQVILDLDNHYLLITLENTGNIADAASMEAHLSYYEQELFFPDDFGKNVFPQFNASIGQPQPKGHTGAELDHIFGGAPFWCEMYFDIPYEMVRKYVDEMILCGFDVRLVAGKANDDGSLALAVLHFSNGDADVAITYDCEDGDISYYTEGGTIWTLLTGEDYYRYIPQK